MPPENDIVLASGYDDLMAPAPAPTFDPSMAGAGSEDIDSNDIVLPRIYLLQGLSKAVVDDLGGAKAGRYWTTPYNRPASFKPEEGMKLVVVRIYPGWRRWNPLDQGGGLECEAPQGDFIAREENGLAGATLKVDAGKDGKVKSVTWEGGHSTNSCLECVFGPAASSAAAGKVPNGRGNPWLPKIVEINGKQYQVPNELRAPRCTQSLDALILAALPPYKDEETGMELQGDVIPAFISFSRTGISAGRSLAGMVKMSPREPAWAKIYSLATKKVTNDKGTFFVPAVSVHGYANAALVEMAKNLYESTQHTSYVPDMSDGADLGDHGASHSTSTSTRPPDDDEPAPTDEF